MNESALEKLLCLLADVTEEQISKIFDVFDLNLDTKVWRTLNYLRACGFDKDQILEVFRTSKATASAPPEQTQCATDSLAEMAVDAPMSSPLVILSPAGGQDSSQSLHSHSPFGVGKHLESGSQPSYFQARTPEYAAQKSKLVQTQNICNPQNVRCVCCGRPYGLEKRYCELCGQEFSYPGALSPHQKKCNGKETKRSMNHGSTRASTRAHRKIRNGKETKRLMKRCRTAASTQRSTTNDIDACLSTAEDQIPQEEHRFIGMQLENREGNAAYHMEYSNSWSELGSNADTPSQDVQDQVDAADHMEFNNPCFGLDTGAVTASQGVRDRGGGNMPIPLSNYEMRVGFGQNLQDLRGQGSGIILSPLRNSEMVVVRGQNLQEPVTQGYGIYLFDDGT